MPSEIVPQVALSNLLTYLESEGRILETDDGIDVFMTEIEMSEYFGVTR